jgi:hypothetical protein
MAMVSIHLTKSYFALSLTFDSPPFQPPGSNDNNGNSELIYGLGFEGRVSIDRSAPARAVTAAATGSSKTATTKAKKDPSGVYTLVAAIKNTKLRLPLRFEMPAKLPLLLSPTGYFRDGTKHICGDFLVIQYKEVDLANGGTVIKLSTNISTRFVGYEHLVNELDQAGVLHNCVTIISTQRETSSHVLVQLGDRAVIWSAPQVVVLLFPCDNIFSSCNRFGAMVEMISVTSCWPQANLECFH